jgi:hypothetical protein
LSQVKNIEGGAIAIDGKTLKGAGQVHLVSAFLQREGIAIAQKEVDAAGAEIDGARQMLKDMDIQQPTLRAKFKEAKWYMAQRYYARRPHLTLGLIGL